jgi:hypothetical protein
VFWVVGMFFFLLSFVLLSNNCRAQRLPWTPQWKKHQVDDGQQLEMGTTGTVRQRQG